VDRAMFPKSWALLLLLLVPFLLGKGEFPMGTAVTLFSLPGAAQEVDPRLLGRWRGAPNGKWAPPTLELRRSPTLLDRYDVEMPWYFGRPVEGRVVRLNGVDMDVLECSVRVRSEDTGLLVAARHHFGIRIEGERLVLSLLSVQLGHMALSGTLGRGPPVRGLDTTLASPVAVVVTTEFALADQLVLAAKRVPSYWVMSFEREP